MASGTRGHFYFSQVYLEVRRTARTFCEVDDEL